MLPELESLETDVAFLPIGGTYTMDVRGGGRPRASDGAGLAVPMHYGFVVGSPGDAERFRDAASPVPVEILTPVAAVRMLRPWTQQDPGGGRRPGPIASGANPTTKEAAP